MTTTARFKKQAQNLDGRVPTKTHNRNSHMERCSTVLITMKTQVKPKQDTTMTAGRASIIKARKTCQRGCRKKGTLVHCWWWCKPPEKRVWRFLNKLKVKMPYVPASPLLGVYLKNTTILIQKETHPYVHGSVIHKSKLGFPGGTSSKGSTC